MHLQLPSLVRLICLVATAACLVGCKDKTPDASTSAGTAPAVTLTLDWVPEPEFGGFYQADLAGTFKSHGLAVKLDNVAGASTWPLVANGKTQFATTSADLLLAGRAAGADLVAIYAVYQKSPTGIMVHKSQKFSKISDVFTHPGTLASEDNAWLKYLLAHNPNPVAKIVPNANGIGQFMTQADFSQQCFVTSEPLAASKAGGDAQTFLVADEGFNPYVTVVITSGKTLKEQPEKVKNMVAACREGWRAYLDNPSPANTAMHKLNPTMDTETFAAAAAAQKPLIEMDSPSAPLGSMTADRWKTLAQQLMDLKLLDKAPSADECFVNIK